MVIDTRRQDARRFDVALCFKSEAPRNNGILCGACGPGVPKERLSTKIMRYVADVLALPPIKVVVILLWLGLLAAGIVGTSRMKVDADVNDFIPEESYLRGFFRVNKDYFTTEGEQAALYFWSAPDLPIDFSDKAVRDNMVKAGELVKANPYTLEGSFDSWYLEFIKTGGNVPQVRPQDSNLNLNLMQRGASTHPYSNTRNFDQVWLCRPKNASRGVC